jgi:tRNA-specific 2-thiouridylase
MPRVLVAMSGGVDSSVAALLMLEAGYSCEGVTMLLDGIAQPDDAAAVCVRLGIKHRVVDLSLRFADAVVGPFVTSYTKGETPNPCIDCNREIKFKALLEYALAEGFDILATGHYARVAYDPEGQAYRLHKAADPEKDQSYVLYQLGQAELSRLGFPLAGLTKAEVRRMAADADLVDADRAESQDICFIPDGDHTGFIRRYNGVEEGITLKPGQVVDESGAVLGEHAGIAAFTIGQRRGLGVCCGRPLYVTRIDAADSRVVVGGEAGLYHQKALLRGFTQPTPGWLGPTFEVAAKYRYRSPAAPARMVMFDDGRWEAQFYEPQKALAPGQSLVCYQGSQVVAGGVIDEVRG